MHCREPTTNVPNPQDFCGPFPSLQENILIHGFKLISSQLPALLHLNFAMCYGRFRRGCEEIPPSIWLISSVFQRQFLFHTCGLSLTHSAPRLSQKIVQWEAYLRKRLDCLDWQFWMIADFISIVKFTVESSRSKMLHYVYPMQGLEQTTHPPYLTLRISSWAPDLALN